MLSSITLHNFRSYGEASYEFGEGVNIIIGPNAVGKTNLLEAIYISASGKGFRSAKDSELIKNGEIWSRVDAGFDSQERSVLLEKPHEGVRLKKSFVSGGNKRSRLSFEDTKPAVLFQPDDLRLMSGSPSRRRDYADTLLSQLIPSFRQDILAYERTLLQRNSFLKSSSRTSDQLFVWNMQLAERGGRIIKRRSELVDEINKNISRIYSKVAGNDFQIKLIYEPSLPAAKDSNSLLAALDKSFNLDIRRGYTTVGPHRDNIAIHINDRPFREVASRGENRTLVLALKIFELQQLEKSRHEKPLLLLDDVFSELDSLRRKSLTKFLRNYQTFITTTDADVVLKHFLNKHTIIAL